MNKQKTKKVLAILLAVSLLMPMLPALPGMSTEVHAAEPAVTQFATLAQLQSSFDLADDKPGTAQRVYFGQNGSGGAQTWYIAGKDPDPNGGLVLMCDLTKPLAKNQPFESDYQNEKTYQSGWG